MGWVIGGVFAAPVLFFVAVWIQRTRGERARQSLQALRPGQLWHGRFTSLLVISEWDDGRFQVELEMWAGCEIVTVHPVMSTADILAHIHEDCMVLAQPLEARLGQEALA